ncbi:MAG: STAS domain-containing protein [Bacteroidota bacterium]
MAINIQIRQELMVVTPTDLRNPLDNKRALDLAEDYILDGHDRILIDLKGIEFFSSAGLNFLLSLLTKSRTNGGDAVVMNISEQASKLLFVTKLKDLFTVVETESEAIDLLTTKA